MAREQRAVVERSITICELEPGVKVVLWIALLIPNLVMELAAWIVAPILGLLVNDAGRLPRWLCVFETADNTAFGDSAHDERWAGRSRYGRVVAWFWRNPAYTFSNDVLAARTSGPVRVSGNHWVSDRPRLVEGWCLRRTDEGYWHFYVVRRWAFGLCLRLNMGWKLAGEPGGPNFGQYVCAVHPFLIRSPTSAASPVRCSDPGLHGMSERGKPHVTSLGAPHGNPHSQVGGEGDRQ